MLGPRKLIEAEHLLVLIQRLPDQLPTSSRDMRIQLPKDLPAQHQSAHPRSPLSEQTEKEPHHCQLALDLTHALERVVVLVLPQRAAVNIRGEVAHRRLDPHIERRAERKVST